MDMDELEAKTKKPQKRNLEPMSLDELAAYIDDLKAEIQRVEADIAKKKSHLAAVNSLFKT